MEKLGERIRQLRLQKQMRLIDFAKKAGLSPSSISQIERNLANPSVATLKKISDALEVPVGYFFESPESSERHINHKNSKSPVVRKDKRKILSPSEGVTFYLLNPDMSGDIEFIYNVFEPGADTGPEFYSHDGEECGIVLEGVLEVQLDKDVYILEEGDSITFKSSIPHKVRNPGKKKACGIWANYPPWF